jgi:uncharacterized protein (TIGR02145 family)
MVFRILTFLLLPVICLAQINTNVEKPTGELLSNEVSPIEMKRNASFNVDEIKVRWKKAALENCTGVPCVVSPASGCGSITSVSDYDGNIYETVSIGTQCWTKTNLKVTKYNDGTLIPDLTASTGNPWAPPSGARTEYVGVTGYVGTFGYLYNWYAATDSRKLCPDGWHVPTDAEWTILIQALDPNQVVNSGNVLTFYGFQSATAGTVLKSDLGWDAYSSPSPGTNKSGFSALPGGYRQISGSFLGIRSYASFWSASSSSLFGGLSVWGRDMDYTNGSVNRTNDDPDYGVSVRCLRD